MPESHALQVLEYTLFHPGWFVNYLAGSRQTAKHIQSSGVLLIDHEKARARVAGSLNNKVSYTAIADFVNIVVKAIAYEGEWPKVGGINGQTLSLAEELAIGEKIRGKCNTGTLRHPGESVLTQEQASRMKSRRWKSTTSEPAS